MNGSIGAVVAVAFASVVAGGAGCALLFGLFEALRDLGCDLGRECIWVWETECGFVKIVERFADLTVCVTIIGLHNSVGALEDR